LRADFLAPSETPSGIRGLHAPCGNGPEGRRVTGLERKLGIQRIDFETLVQTRRSVRGFRNEPVPRALLEEIIEVAKRAPSSMNTQP
jgi:hypothetical protein